jgi:hypothetical protein
VVRSKPRKSWLLRLAHRIDDWVEPDPEKRVELSRNQVETASRKHGIDSLQASGARVDLADTLERHQRWDEARQTRAEEVESRVRRFGPESKWTMVAEEALAADCWRCGMVDEAIILMRQVLAIRIDTFGADHKSVRMTRRTLAKMESHI